MQQPSLWRCIVLIGLWCVMNLFGHDQAFAQSRKVSPLPGLAGRKMSPGRGSRPTLSPYLDLLNPRSGGVATSYYNNVRPRQEFQKSSQSLNKGLQSIESRVQGLQVSQTAQTNAEPVSTGRMSPTGHSTSSGNLGGYYPGAR